MKKLTANLAVFAILADEGQAQQFQMGPMFGDPTDAPPVTQEEFEKQEAIFRREEKIVLIHQSKLNKLHNKWEDYRTKLDYYIADYNVTGCDTDCTGHCWDQLATQLDPDRPDNATSHIQDAFISCVVPFCQCQSEMKLKFLPLPAVTDRQALWKDEGVVLNKDVIMTCNTGCAGECLSLKKNLPFPAIAQCVRTVCGCNYNLDVPMTPKEIEEQKEKEAEAARQIAFSNEGSNCTNECALGCSQLVTRDQINNCFINTCGCGAAADPKHPIRYAQPADPEEEEDEEDEEPLVLEVARAPQTVY